MDSTPTLRLDSTRRFGVEIEVNSFDGLSKAPGADRGVLPAGIHYVANLVNRTLREKVLVHKYGNDHYNDSWVVKPDSSCGIEVCTPVMKGWNGVSRVCRAVEAFSEDPRVRADDRCSLHVHVDVSDLSPAALASVLTWWVKCEPVFLDSVPPRRKRCQYCQCLGQMDFFGSVEGGLLLPDVLVHNLGQCKYYTLNTYHMAQKKRRTIEFRIMDESCCRDPWSTKNWTRLVLHFVERAVAAGLPAPYQSGDPRSGYAWMDPFDVFDFLGFLPGQYDLSPGLGQVRSWFLSKLDLNARNTGLQGVMSDAGRSISVSQIDLLLAAVPSAEHDTPEALYGDKFKV